MLMRAATVVSCASLAGLVLSFIACFILLVIAPLVRSSTQSADAVVHMHAVDREVLVIYRPAEGRRPSWPEHCAQ